MAPAAQRRGAICAALGAIACAGLLGLWADAPDPQVARPDVRSDRGHDAVHAVPPSTGHLDGDSSTDETGVGNPDTLAALVVALGDVDANVRVDAVSDLGVLSGTQAESLLEITAMQDPAPVVRIEALYALESRHAESQLAAFRHALHDPDENVRKAAISALEELEGD